MYFYTAVEKFNLIFVFYDDQHLFYLSTVAQKSQEMYLILPIHNNFPYKIICNQTWIVPRHKPLGSQMSCLHPLTPVTHRIQSLLKKAPPVNEWG